MSVPAGVLQQLRRDVVPEGNHPVLTVMGSLHPPSSSGVQWEESDNREPITAL